MATPDRTRLERWEQLAREGLRDMEAWVAENAGSPIATQVQALINATQVSVDALGKISRRLLKAELLAEKALLQAKIDEIDAQLGNP